MSVTLHGAAAEVALSEAQSVLSFVHDPLRRGRLADLVAAVQDGELLDEEAQALEELLELGLASGRIRGLYGPEGEQAALATYRRLPRGRELTDTADTVSEALAALEGRTLERVTVSAPGPGTFLVTLAAEGLELSVRLDRTGARLHSVGV